MLSEKFGISKEGGIGPAIVLTIAGYSGGKTLLYGNGLRKQPECYREKTNPVLMIRFAKSIRSVGKKLGILLVARRTAGLVPIILEYLPSQGFTVDVVESYNQVSCELSFGTYAAVLATDSGLRADDILKAVLDIKERFPTIRIVVLSAWYPDDFVQHLKECGIDDFFPMPFKIDALSRRLNKLLC